MRKLLSVFTFFIFMSTAGISSIAAEETHLFWIAGKFLNKIYTNYDVTQYMERALLDDAQRGKLFKEAGGDYNQYKTLVRKYTKKSFGPALKVLMYNKILEHHATFGKSVGEWKAFRISPSDYHKRIQDLENKVLKPLLDKRLGIVKSRDQFGAYLIENNFPHKEGESNTDVYFRWYNDQKFRLKHELRTSEAQRYEAIAAMGHRRELYIRPTEQNDFFKRVKREIERDLEGKKLSQTEVSNILRKNPDLKVVIKDIHYLSLNSAPLSRILEESAQKFEEAKAIAINGITPSLSMQKINKVLSYEALAAKMAKKYNDVDKLTKASQKAMEKFMATSNYKEIMKAKLYALAATLVEEKADRSNIAATITNVLEKAMADLKVKLPIKETYTSDNVKKLLFEDLIVVHLRDSIKEQLGSRFDGYLKKALNMALWTIEFDAKKIAINAKPEVSVELREYMTFETQKRIQDHLKMLQFKELMTDFRENQLRRRMEGLFSVDLDGKNQLNGTNAFDWLLEN
ncbi:MAG: hypothetical protein CME70_19870 [Halobacteriovorax sp.]|nr:hypothetical protein [Halobacteriovorax sp.]|tara:strand:+ start:36257 stop:37801 length:1545 start_codon:yes stop_codon:yes gene_type:complete